MFFKSEEIKQKISLYLGIAGIALILLNLVFTGIMSLENLARLGYYAAPILPVLAILTGIPKESPIKTSNGFFLGIAGLLLAFYGYNHRINFLINIADAMNVIGSGTTGFYYPIPSYSFVNYSLLYLIPSIPLALGVWIKTKRAAGLKNTLATALVVLGTIGLLLLNISVISSLPVH